MISNTEVSAQWLFDHPIYIYMCVCVCVCVYI